MKNSTAYFCRKASEIEVIVDPHYIYKYIGPTIEKEKVAMMNCLKYIEGCWATFFFTYTQLRLAYLHKQACWWSVNLQNHVGRFLFLFNSLAQLLLDGFWTLLFHWFPFQFLSQIDFFENLFLNLRPGWEWQNSQSSHGHDICF